MGYPDLYSDESVILQAQNIKVKSVSFEAILTSRRLILVDNKKDFIPPQEILLATLKDIDTSENAIRDPVLTLSVITSSGATRQIILTFSKVSGGERKRECDEWARLLKEHLSLTFQHTSSSAAGSVFDAEPAPASQQPSTTPRKIEITNAPLQKKKIEIARPIKKIVETVPAMPKPVETSTLPTGSFCNRCGNRVPPESVFCNRCGTPVVIQEVASEPVVQPAPVIQQEPDSSVPQVQVPIPAPVFGAAADKKDSPIEQVIHSIEPLIEDSVPRTEPAPLIPRHLPQQPAESSPAESPGVSPPGVQWPVLSASGTPDAQATAPGSPPPVNPVPKSPIKKRGIAAFAIIAIVILAVLAGAFMVINSPEGIPGIPISTTPTPPETTEPTTVATPTPTASIIVSPAVTTATTPPPPVVIIPKDGVWLRVIYPGKFSGSYGTPGFQTPVTDTGDRFYMVSTINGPVEASIKKMDGSANELVIEVYKNGDLVKRETTVSPRGTIDFQVDLKPAPTPTPEPTAVVTPFTTTTTRSTSNTTGTA